MRLPLLAALALCLCTSAAGGEGDRLPCAPQDKPCAIRAAMAHPAKQWSWWKPVLAKPFPERIGPAPARLVEFIALDNIANGFPNKPKSGKPPADFERDVKAAFEELPEAVKRPLMNRLAGIYFVEDLGGTGYTDMIVDAAGKPAGGFIVLDPSVLLQHTANSWATWRDGTPFKPSANERLEVTIEDKASDNRKQAIQYILLHEIGHALSIGANFHPSWNVPPEQVGPTSQYPYYELSWRVGGAPLAHRTLFDAAFPQRKDIVYYFGPRIPAEQMVETYTGLGKTNFATLYSASHPGDDFAEAFANYVHVVMMKKPFEIRLYHFGQLALSYPACWSEPRCAPKRAILEALLK